MKKLFIYLLAAVLLTACSTMSGNDAYRQQFADGTSTRDYFPGGVDLYNFGQGQSFEDFENVARAQSYFGLFTKYRGWNDLKPSKTPSANVLFLPGYLPLDVRWKLKDGREFILEKIDLRAIMRDYFKNNRILLQHQQENRAMVISDFLPELLHGVKDDTVIIKWQIRINNVPLELRKAPATKEINPLYRNTTQQHLVIAIKGKPTSGINFEADREYLK